jgi:hypothetical protein
MQVQERLARCARGSSDEGDDLEHVAPGFVRAFAKVNHELTCSGDGGLAWKRLSREPANQIKQRLMLVANAGELDAMLTQVA